MGKIYAAGSFSNKEEKSELDKLIRIIREQHPNDELYIPMEHFVPGGNDKDESGNYIMSNEEWAKKVFEMDVAAIDSSDEIIALYRGRYSGTGTAWELGYAFGKQKPTTVYVPDGVDTTSLMIINSATKIISSSIFEQK